ncbi:hypothetical protein [Micromonospora sp. CPCC 205556]|uniref:hypothetical protein n=1 Tax=Micromonospora sp. CPCC 205556 TaxID=3122398 RepID=UPI002FF371A6
MTTMWTVLTAFALLAVAAFGWVLWRDRARRAAGEARAADRAARADQQRYETGRHASQGEIWQRDDRTSPG